MRGHSTTQCPVVPSPEMVGGTSVRTGPAIIPHRGTPGDDGAARDNADAASIRGFLRSWRKATEGGNPAGFTLRVRAVPKQPNHAVIFAEGVGGCIVKWLPVLVVPMSDHFTQIMRECGDLPRFSYDRVKRADAWGQPEKPSKPRCWPRSTSSYCEFVDARCIAKSETYDLVLAEGDHV